VNFRQCVWQLFETMKHRKKRWCLPASVTLASALAKAPELLAQGCAMCKTVAAAQSKEAAASLNWGILLLLVPPVTIMSSLLVFAFRCRNVPRPTLEAGRSGGNEDVTPTAA
jgi:hypothetical protein